MAKSYQKVFKASNFRYVKQPTFTIKGVEYLNCGIDLRTNIVTIKNISQVTMEKLIFMNCKKR